MKFKIALASATILAASMFSAASAADLTIGFSQIGSESGWRAAETTLTKQQAEKRGIDLKFADAQQKLRHGAGKLFQRVHHAVQLRAPGIRDDENGGGLPVRTGRGERIWCGVIEHGPLTMWGSA